MGGKKIQIKFDMDEDSDDTGVYEEDKEELKGKIEKLKEVLKNDNIEEIKKESEELSKVAQKVGASLYQAAKAEKPKEGPPPAEATEDNQKA